MFCVVSVDSQGAEAVDPIEVTDSDDLLLRNLGHATGNANN
jgi:hypothetical protein